jgi:hypothetical protein
MEAALPPTYDAQLQICEYYDAPAGKARVPADQVPALVEQLWDSSKSWVYSKDTPVLAEELQDKYPDHMPYRFQFHRPMFASERAVPSRSAVFVRLPAGSDREYDVFTLSYPTVCAGTATTLPNGMSVMVMNLKEKRPPTPDVTHLKDTLWYQLGDSGGAALYLVKLQKNPQCDPTICVGHKTNDLYPYRLAEAYVLVKKP